MGIYKITPEQVIELNKKLRKEILRRSGLNEDNTQIISDPNKRHFNGKIIEIVDGVPSFDINSLEFIHSPEDGKVIIAEHGQKLIDPMLIISDFLDLEAAKFSGPINDAYDYNLINAQLIKLSNEAFMTDESSCRSSCTGLCVGTCGITCTSDCTGECTGCSSTCEGICTGCSGCSETCGSKCGQSCANTCVASVGGCNASCGGGCKGCDTGCSGCSNGCQGCVGLCSASCTGGCKNSCTSGCKNSCGGCYSTCNTACGYSCTGSVSSYSVSFPNYFNVNYSCLSCVSACTNNCSGRCLNTCSNICTTTCIGSCTYSCNTMCSNESTFIGSATIMG